MWIFAEQGLLMPSQFPRDKVDPKYLKPEYDLQIRGRVREHLERWAEKYMAPGSYSAIEETPRMDYNVRFYCSHDDFAWAMGKAIADIDYRKFKPVAEKPAYGKIGQEYHAVLNSIWSTVTRLGSPGGYWAPYNAKTNPEGYKPNEYSSRYKASSTAVSHYTGALLEPMWYDDEDDLYATGSGAYTGGDGSWTPTKEEEADLVIADLVRSAIPTKEWHDSCTEEEWSIIKPYFRREQRKEKRAERRSRRQHGKAA